VYSFEPIFEVDDHVIHAIKDSTHSPLGIPWYNKRDLVDGYLEQSVGVQLNLFVTPLGVEPLKSQPQELVVTFEKVHVQGSDGKDSPRNRKETPSDFRERSCDDMQSSVAVLPCTIVQDSQCVNADFLLGCGTFGNIVRLYRLDPVPQLLGEWRTVYGILAEFSGVGAYRKFNTIFIGGRVCFLRDHRCFVNQIVQGGSQLIEHLSKLQCEVVFGDGRSSLIPNDSLGPIAIWLYDGLIGFQINKSFPYSLNGFCMKHRPLKSLATVDE